MLWSLEQIYSSVNLKRGNVLKTRYYLALNLNYDSIENGFGFSNRDF